MPLQMIAAVSLPTAKPLSEIGDPATLGCDSDQDLYRFAQYRAYIRIHANDRNSACDRQGSAVGRPDATLNPSVTPWNLSKLQGSDALLTGPAPYRTHQPLPSAGIKRSPQTPGHRHKAHGRAADHADQPHLCQARVSCQASPWAQSGGSVRASIGCSSS
jgi:hypothetical protein